MTLVREFNLYLNAGKSIPLVINVNQYDYGEQWVFTLYSDNGTQYTPSSGAIVGIKSDNLGIINTGTVDSQGRVVINETQQMTAAVGKATFELLIDGQTHGTANFFVLVEPKPGDNADLSESDYSLFQEAINGTSATAIAQGVSDWMDENLTPTTPVVDASLTVSGAAADAKKTGDEISDLKSAIETIEGGDGLTSAIKSALLQIAQKVAYIDDDGQTYYDDLYDALYPPIVVTAITLNTNSLSFGTLNATQQLTATTTPSGGAVTWTSSNTSIATVSQTGVVTSVGYGSAIITATSGSVSATCSVAITQATLSSISAVYTQSGTVYDTDSLDSLKSDLVVTATYNDSSTAVIPSASYTLSGTLAEGTSTITVSYSGKTTTFSVTVTPAPDYILPSTYQEVEWVGKGTSSGNSAYITTNISETDKTGLNGYALDCSTEFGSNDSGQAIGISIAWSGNAGCYLGGWKTGNKVALGANASYSFPENITTGTKYDLHMYWTDAGGYAEIGNDSASRTWSSTANAQTLVLGTGSVANNTANTFKFYGAVVVKKNNVLVGNFVPCYRISDTAIGFYDTVSENFYTHANFEKGADI